jgi:hypothetical protein
MLLMAAFARKSILEGRLAQTSLLEVCDVPKGPGSNLPKSARENRPLTRPASR